MVEVQGWLDQNYPKNGVCQNIDDKENYGKKGRKDITKLTISNKDLEGSLNLTDFINLQFLDMSSNRLQHFYPAGENIILEPYENSYFENNVIKEIYCSNNNFSTSWGKWKTDALSVLDHSNNEVKNYTLIARSLAYLNASNNELNKLDLSKASQSLVELRCSGGNSFENGLNLTYAPSLKYFDCLGFKLNVSTVTETITINHDDSKLVLGLGAGTGVTGFLAIVTFCWALYLRKQLIGRWFC